jgi:two-component system, NarL family, sensor kinase
MKHYLRKYLFIFCAGPGFCYCSQAQNILIDSLRQDYMAEKNDSVKIRKGVFYAYNLAKSDMDASLRLLAQLKTQSVEKGIASYYPRIAAELGNIYYEKGDYIKSITYCEQSLREYETAPVNRVTWLGKAWAYMWAGLSYSLINDWENAQINLQASVNASEQAGDTCRLINSSMNLAYIFFDMQAWQQMYETLKKNQQFLTGCSDNDVSLMTTSSLAFVCAKLKKKSEAAGALALAEKYLNSNVTRSLEIFYYTAKLELALLNYRRGEAVDNANKAKISAGQSKDPYYITVSTNGVGRALVAAGDKKKGIEYLVNSLSLAKQNNFLSLQQQTLQQLSLFFESEDDINNAYRYSRELLKLKDSLAEKINVNRRLLLDAKFETGRKENLISQLEAEKKIQQLSIRQKNILNYILIGSAATLLIISILSYRNYRQNQKLQQQRINELETEKQLAATEAVLKGEERERTRLAKDLHDGLGGMLSGIKYSLNIMKGNLIMTPDNAQAFERSIDMLDSSIKEMRRVAHNMMPEALVKFGLDTALKDFCSDINQSGALKVNYQSIGLQNAVIEQTTAVTIYRIVQELLNNTMKHAAAKNAIVQVSKTDSLLTVTVEDDGKGFDASLLQQPKGIGWANIQNRVEFLKGKLDVNSQAGKGTSVLIELTT